MSQIIVCDYCKDQADKDNLFRLIFKQGKKELSRHDVCGKCHTQLLGFLEAKFVGRRPEEKDPIPPVGTRRAELSQAGSKDLVQGIEDGSINPESLLDETATTDTQPVESAKAQGSSGGPEVVASTDEEGNCLHANRGRIIFGKGVKVPYQVCQNPDCKKKIPIQKPVDKGLDEPLPQGVRMRDDTK